MAVETRVVKEILVDVDKCTGCKTCEMACSAVHAVPRYSVMNPARSRIRVVIDEQRDVFVPVRAGNFAQAECNGRNVLAIDGKEYSECTFCRASCPSREAFTDPDSGLPLRCDMCEGLSLAVPMCVQACQQGALVYLEREEAAREGEPASREEVDIGLEALVRAYGLKKVTEAVARKARRAR